jgi:hypothetical protein
MYDLGIWESKADFDLRKLRWESVARQNIGTRAVKNDHRYCSRLRLRRSVRADGK